MEIKRCVIAKTSVHLNAIERTQEWKRPRVDGVESTHCRADAVTGTTSHRWRGASGGLFQHRLAEDDWGILGSAFRKAPVALVVVWVVVAVVATVAVHSVHCKLLWEHAPASPRSPRTARRAELVANQRRDLSP